MTAVSTCRLPTSTGGEHVRNATPRFSVSIVLPATFYRISGFQLNEEAGISCHKRYGTSFFNSLEVIQLHKEPQKINLIANCPTLGFTEVLLITPNEDDPKAVFGFVNCG